MFQIIFALSFPKLIPFFRLSHHTKHYQIDIARSSLLKTSVKRRGTLFLGGATDLLLSCVILFFRDLSSMRQKEEYSSKKNVSISHFHNC